MNALFLGLHTRHLGTETRQLVNPFTGELRTVYRDKGMTAAELDASSALLAEFGASEPDPEGFREIIFPDGNCVQVDLGPVTAEIHIEGRLTLPVAEFVFQLALASGMLVCSTIDPAVIAVLPGQRHIGIESRWPDFACVGCADELMAWIEREIDEGRIAG